LSIEPNLPIDSKSRCETTTGRDNELFWTEKFIVPAGLNFMRRRSVGAGDERRRDGKESRHGTSGRYDTLAARQAHRKHRAFAWLARHDHVPAHHARELAGDGKAEPRPAIAPCCE